MATALDRGVIQFKAPPPKKKGTLFGLKELLREPTPPPPPPPKKKREEGLGPRITCKSCLLYRHKPVSEIRRLEEAHFAVDAGKGPPSIDTAVEVTWAGE